MTENYTSKIPEQVYVGFQKRSGDGSVPLGFLTPYTNDAAGKKRMATVDNWAGKNINSVILDNIPMVGFRISRSIRRLGWRSTNVLIRIEDPRGFELEITVSNFIMLTDNNIIQDGEILQECVWGRDGGINMLLPVNSEPYLQALANTQRATESVSLRDLKLGYEVELRTGEVGVYVGPFHPVMAKSLFQKESGRLKLETKRHFIRTVNDGAVSYETRSAFKVSKIKAKDEMSEAEIRDMIANDFENGRVSSSIPGLWGSLNGLFRSASPEFQSLEVVPITEDEATFQSRVGGAVFANLVGGDVAAAILSEARNNPTYGKQYYASGFGYVTTGLIPVMILNSGLLFNDGTVEVKSKEFVTDSRIKNYFQIAKFYKDGKDGVITKVTS